MRPKSNDDPKRIQEYLDYLRSNIDRIDNLCQSVHDGQCRLFKKTLLFALLDGLATPLKSSQQPRRLSQQQNLREFLIVHGRWPNGERVSLPHLCRWLDQNPDAMTQKGHTLFKEMLASWQEGEIRRPADDPTIDNIKPHFSEDIPNLENRIIKMTHGSLLMQHRNCLAHEFLHSGVNLEFPNDTEPYYVSLSSINQLLEPEKSVENTWQLFYPTGFLFELARRCLESISEYLMANQIDPRESYSLGHYLLPELN